jgi:hypothetical protein
MELRSHDTYVCAVLKWAATPDQTTGIGTAVEAIAVDSYPAYAMALPLDSLPKDRDFSVKLIRTPCRDRQQGS